MKKLGLYYIKDDESGEIINASFYKEDLDFFVEHPDYKLNPFLPRSTSLEEFINISGEVDNFE